jgi:hypothetical protein
MARTNSLMSERLAMFDRAKNSHRPNGHALHLRPCQHPNHALFTKRGLQIVCGSLMSPGAAVKAYQPRACAQLVTERQPGCQREVAGLRFAHRELGIAFSLLVRSATENSWPRSSRSVPTNSRTSRIRHRPGSCSLGAAVCTKTR